MNVDLLQVVSLVVLAVAVACWLLRLSLRRPDVASFVLYGLLLLICAASMIWWANV